MPCEEVACAIQFTEGILAGAQPDENVGLELLRMRYLRLALIAYVGSFILIFLGSWIHIRLGPSKELLEVQRDDGTWDVEWAKTGPDVVPKNMVEAVKQIEVSLIREQLTEYRAFLAMTQDELDRLSQSEAFELMERYGHLGIGMWIRNSWGLWWNSRLARWLLWRGCLHPDDMSAAVLREFESHVRGDRIDSRNGARLAIVGVLSVVLVMALGATLLVVNLFKRASRSSAHATPEG